MSLTLSCFRKRPNIPYLCFAFMMAFAISSWLAVSTSSQNQEPSRSHVTFAQGLKKASRGPTTLATLDQPPALEKSEAQKTSASAIEARFARRRSRVQEACLHLKLRRNRRLPSSSQRFLFPTTTSPVVLYCPVPKTGTSFIRQLFSTANNMSGPVFWSQRYNKRPVKDYNKAVMFFFTRDPYTRLLSAYIDKLWSPNPSFWSALGRHIVKKFRPKANAISRKCGHDVTFPEAVSYFIRGQQKGRNLNSHFIPTNEFCDICNYSYDYIGKMETFAEDLAHILSAINLTASDVSNSDQVYEAADSAFNAALRRPACINKEAALKRVWRGLQIRGLLSMDVKFPFPPSRSRNITRNEFRQVMEAAVRKSEAQFAQRGEQLVRTQGHLSGDHGLSGSELFTLAREQQRQEVLASVYSLVPLADRHRMKELLEPEFQLFGYEPKPQAIFTDKFKIDKDIFSLSTF